MATSVQITLIICVTLVVILLVTHLMERYGYRNQQGRLGEYQRLLAALSEVKSDPGNDRS